MVSLVQDMVSGDEETEDQESNSDSDDDDEQVCYDKNTASWDNLCLAVMRHPDQSIHAAAEIATAVLKVSIFLLIEWLK